MKTIDRTKPVLVTGANGYIASWLVKLLLDEGMTVHAAVRNPKDEVKLAHLITLSKESKGNLIFFKGDLLSEGSYKAAMEGCEVVFHTASPFTSKFTDPQKELVDPAVLGTKNVLLDANRTPSVKRVVLTSSCAAIYTDCIDIDKTPKGILDESIWNTTASLTYQPYSLSKTLAEQEAWSICKAQNQWDLVTINPSLVIGPALNTTMNTSESHAIFKQLTDGSLKMGVPDLGMGVVDVRDVAKAHFLAAFTPNAEGRHITNGHNTSFLKMAQILHKQYGNKYPMPNRALPKWLILLVGPLLNKSLDRRFIRGNVNLAFKADNSKSINQLGLKYRPLEETLSDGFKAFIENKIVG